MKKINNFEEWYKKYFSGSKADFYDKISLQIGWKGGVKETSYKLDLAKETLKKIAYYNLNDSDPLRDCAMRQWAKECFDKLNEWND